MKLAEGLLVLFAVIGAFVMGWREGGKKEVVHPAAIMVPVPFPVECQNVDTPTQVPTIRYVQTDCEQARNDSYGQGATDWGRK